MSKVTPLVGTPLFYGNSIDLNNVAPWVFDHVDNVIVKLARSILDKEDVLTFPCSPYLSSSRNAPIINNYCSVSGAGEKESDSDSLAIPAFLAAGAFSLLLGRSWAMYEKYSLLFKRHAQFRDVFAEELKSSWKSLDQMNRDDRTSKEAILNEIMSPLEVLSARTYELLDEKCKNAFVDVALSVSLLAAACFIAIGFALSSPFLKSSGLILGVPTALYALIRYGYHAYTHFDQDRATEILDLTSSIKDRMQTQMEESAAS